MAISGSGTISGVIGLDGGGVSVLRFDGGDGGATGVLRSSDPVVIGYDGGGGGVAILAYDGGGGGVSVLVFDGGGGVGNGVSPRPTHRASASSAIHIALPSQTVGTSYTATATCSDAAPCWISIPAATGTVPANANAVITGIR